MITKIMLDAVKYMLLEKMITAGIFNLILKFIRFLKISHRVLGGSQT